MDFYLKTRIILEQLIQLECFNVFAPNIIKFWCRISVTRQKIAGEYSRFTASSGILAIIRTRRIPRCS